MTKFSPTKDIEWPITTDLREAAINTDDPRQLHQQTFFMHRERLAAIGQAVAEAAHEIANPLTAIACLARNITEQGEDDNLKELSARILVQTDRASSILRTLVSFAHRGKPDGAGHRVSVDIHRCVEEAISLVSIYNPKQVTLTNACPRDQHVMGNPQRLTQVFVNLLSNALDASDEAGRVTVSGESVEGDGAEALRVLVRDQGHGIEAEQMGNIFDPFFTTKPPGAGTGLGLAVVETILAEHEGRISIEPGLPRGTLVTLSLPLAEKSPVTPNQP